MVAKIVCVEGTEGCGKTTQCKKLAGYLRDKGYTVLETKEPGTPVFPVTNELRRFVLDAQYGESVTPVARELITQAIRSIHLEKVINPGLATYDYIIQDRGMLSGWAYGNACGHELTWLLELSAHLIREAKMDQCCDMKGFTLEHKIRELCKLYDHIIFLGTDRISEKLDKAKSAKQEYEAGDFIEAKGNTFMETVNSNFDYYLRVLRDSGSARRICVDGKDIDGVFADITDALNI